VRPASKPKAKVLTFARKKPNKSQKYHHPESTEELEHALPLEQNDKREFAGF
jgi:hypothetical protein